LDEPAAAAAADLAAFAAGIAGLVRGPLVGRPLLMGSAPALAGDLPLLLGGHGGESPPFLAFSVVHRPVLCYVNHDLHLGGHASTDEALNQTLCQHERDGRPS